MSKSLAEATAKLEAKKPFSTHLLQLCSDASLSAATIATRFSSNKEEQSALAQFWKLYWGPMAIVESRSIESAMVDFGNCLSDAHCEQDRKKVHSLRLAHACREAISSGFEVDLKPLQGKAENPDKDQR